MQVRRWWWLPVVPALPLLVGQRASAEGGAYVVRDMGFWYVPIPDAPGSYFSIEPFHWVWTPSENGRSKVTAKFDKVPNSTGRAVAYSGKKTGWWFWFTGPDFYRVTNDWTFVIAANGNATLQMHFSDEGIVP